MKIWNNPSSKVPLWVSCFNSKRNGATTSQFALWMQLKRWSRLLFRLEFSRNPSAILFRIPMLSSKTFRNKKAVKNRVLIVFLYDFASFVIWLIWSEFFKNSCSRWLWLFVQWILSFHYFNALSDKQQQW